jgi:hypothetical protein
MFGGGAAGCTAQMTADAETGLLVGRCGCSGYTSDASAFGEKAEIVDVVELRLRVSGATEGVEVRLAPARDLFDAGTRPDKPCVPWRPHD